MNKPILGVLGGVGPLATAYFMEAVIKRTPARADQDNIPMIVFNDPQIPDRTAYILDHDEPNPVPEMAKVARWLQDAGADYIAIPCNTAHYFYDTIDREVSIPVLNIMDETARHIAQKIGAPSTVGLLATEGTASSGVFQSYLEREGMQTVVPDKETQRLVSHIIYDQVKANVPYDRAAFLDAAHTLRKRGCDAVVVGCTELSVIYQDLETRPSWLFDSLDILARRCVEFYLKERASHAEEI